MGFLCPFFVLSHTNQPSKLFWEHQILKQPRKSLSFLFLNLKIFYTLFQTDQTTEMPLFWPQANATLSGLWVWGDACNLVYPNPDGRQQLWLSPRTAVRVQVLPGLSSYHQIQTGTQREMQFTPDGQTQRRAGCESSVFVPLSKKPVDSDLIHAAAWSPGDTQWFASKCLMIVIDLLHLWICHVWNL